MRIEDLGDCQDATCSTEMLYEGTLRHMPDDCAIMVQPWERQISLSGICSDLEAIKHNDICILLHRNKERELFKMTSLLNTCVFYNIPTLIRVVQRHTTHCEYWEGGAPPKENAKNAQKRKNISSSRS